MIKDSRSETAFVLAGGGSLGAVQVGMLKALAFQDVKADFVVGTSVGAINAAYFAGEPTSEGARRLEEVWCELRRGDVFPLAPLRSLFRFISNSDYLVDPAAISDLLEQELPYKQLEDAVIPCHVVATDILGGDDVRLSSGPAVKAVLASISIPGIFPPVEIGGRHLLDGGVANNTPISIAADLGATRIIVLPTGISCAIEKPPKGALAMALHALSLLIARQLVADVAKYAGSVKLFVIPPLCPIKVLLHDFSSTEELIEQSEASTLWWLENGGLQAGTEVDPLRPHLHTK